MILKTFDILLIKSVIISKKHGIYDLPHQLLNDLRLRILGNQERSEKSKKLIEF